MFRVVPERGMNSIMRDLATRLVNRFGYEIIPRWRLDHFEPTKYLRRLFDYLQIDCVRGNDGSEATDDRGVVLTLANA